MKSRDESLIYLYCVSAEKPKLNEAESLVDNVYFISYQGLYPVCSRVSPDEFSEKNLKKNLADLEWIKTTACNHEKVIEAVMNPALPNDKQLNKIRKGGVKNSCVIPFKLGTLFNSEENLKTMLKEHMGEFKDTLKWLEGREEWGLKIYCDVDKLKENLIQKDKELLDLDRQISAALPGKAFILKKKKAELLNIIINKKLNESGQDSFERLKQYSISSGINKLLPKEVTERKDDMILNAVFLIDKNKAADLADTVKEIKALYAGWGLSFDCTGPWPPYNFITIEKA